LLIEAAGMYWGFVLDRVTNIDGLVLRRWALVFSGSTIGIFYYATGLITPSYNWLNLLSLCLGAIACTKIIGHRVLRWIDVLAFSLILTSASWLGLFAKFTSSIGICLIAVAVLFLNRNTIRDFLRIGFASTGMFALFALLHQVLIEPWSITLDKFARGHQNLLLLDPGYSNARALDNFKFGVTQWFKTLPKISIGLTVFLLGVLLIAISVRILGFQFESPKASKIRLVIPVVALLSAFYVACDNGLWAGYSAKYINQMWAVSLLLMASLLLSIAMLLATRNLNKRLSYLKLLPIAIAIGLAVLYAIGSGNGFIAQLTGAAGFLLVAASFIPLAIPKNLGTITAALVTLLGSIGAAETTHQGNLFPYRQASRSEQTMWLSIGSHRGSLLVDSQMKELVTSLRHSIAMAGWKKNSPLLDLTKYSAGLVYLLEAQAPVTIIPTVGMYPTVDAVMNWAVTKALEDDPTTWKNAWLLTPATNYSDVIDGRPNPTVISLLGHQFPQDYEIVAKSFDYVIWKLKAL
jgi:hypothetical protein